jgi:hypothetical protein
LDDREDKSTATVLVKLQVAGPTAGG